MIHGVSISARTTLMQRDGESPAERAQHGPERVDDRVLGGAREPAVERVVGVEEDRAVVLQTVPRRVEQLPEREDVQVLERQEDAAEHRQQVHEHHQDHGGRDQADDQPPARASQRAAAPSPRRLRHQLADRRRLGG
jgi:hypothetical protein